MKGREVETGCVTVLAIVGTVLTIIGTVLAVVGAVIVLVCAEALVLFLARVLGLW